MMMLKEVNVFGIFVAPMALYLVIGAIAFASVRKAIAYFKLGRFIWHPSLFDVALFVSFVSLTTIVAIYSVG